MMNENIDGDRPDKRNERSRLEDVVHVAPEMGHVVRHTQQCSEAIVYCLFCCRVGFFSMLHLKNLLRVCSFM